MSGIKEYALPKDDDILKAMEYVGDYRPHFAPPNPGGETVIKFMEKRPCDPSTAVQKAWHEAGRER